MSDKILIRRNLVVGCGLSGAVVARRLAEELGEQVVAIDQKSQVGGLCFDFVESNGCRIQKYGRHVFHTDRKAVWDYLRRYTKWIPYTHKMFGMIDGKCVTLPLNLDTLHELFSKTVAEQVEKSLLQFFSYGKQVTFSELMVTNHEDLIFLVRYLYEKYYKFVIFKELGNIPSEMEQDVLKQIQFRINRDGRLFQERYQGIPSDGYTGLVQNLLNHPNIKVKLNTGYVKEMLEAFDRCFFTGSIDTFFAGQIGNLSYRGVRYEWIHRKAKDSEALVECCYANQYDFLRTIEFQQDVFSADEKTALAYEYFENYQENENEPCIPLRTKEDELLYLKYDFMAKKIPNVYFLGQLGRYRSYHMDQVVFEALRLTKGLVQKEALKIYIASHRPVEFVSGPAYCCIQVGKKAGDKSFSAISDDSKISIAEKNAHYSELTAMYWIWKNDLDSKIVGLVHYRRYFDFENRSRFLQGEQYARSLTKEFWHGCSKTTNVVEYLSEADVILPPAVQFLVDIKTQYAKMHRIQDLDLARSVVGEIYPEYLETWDMFFSQKKMHCYNMLVASRPIFCAYAKWLFDILFELERRIKLPVDTYQSRVFAFLAERLLNVYMLHHQYKIHCVNVLGINWGHNNEFKSIKTEALFF